VTQPQVRTDAQHEKLDQRLLQRKAEGILVWDSPLRDLSQVADQVRVLNEALGGERRRIWPGAYGIEPIFHRLLEELERPIPSGEKEKPAQILKVMMVQALLVEMLVFIARHQLDLNELQQASRRVATPEMHFWLQQRVGAPPSLREMAAYQNLSPAHFAVTFKHETGLTPLEYMTHLRIDTAAKRLRTEPHISITQIALDLGFSSPQYFSMVFQKVKGCSPTQWRFDVSTQ
jgi:AraC-like DNA-binding protein